MTATATYDAERLQELRASFTGAILEPGDAAYDEARQVHNALVDRRPALIAHCRTTFAAGLDALRPTGRMILYGAASGEPDAVEPRVLMAKGSLYLQRPTLATYTRTPEVHCERAAALFDLIARGALDVRIGARYPLAEARRAHEALEARRTAGKLLLVP